MKSGILITALGVFAIISAFTAGYLYLKSQSSVKISTTTGAVLTPTESPVAESPSPEPEVKQHTAAVVFAPPLSGDFADKDEIRKKVVEPFLDYYADENGEGYLISLTISENPFESKGSSPYTGKAIFKNGGEAGFTITKTGGAIQYWAPECMVCTFSASFKEKYPEIVKKF